MRSRAATAFISVQVLRSRVFDASAAINLMKPIKRCSNPPGWVHPPSQGLPAPARCPAGLSRRRWHRPQGRTCLRSILVPSLAGQQPGALAAARCQGHGADPVWPV